MIKQGFSIGDRDWYIMAFYDIRTDEDFEEIQETLIASGQKPAYAQRVCNELMWPNTGYTYTNYRDHLTVICISEATSLNEKFNTINHEIKHAVEHIGAYYRVDSESEESAYLQGEISKNMYEAVVIAICPVHSKIY